MLEQILSKLCAKFTEIFKNYSQIYKNIKFICLYSDLCIFLNQQQNFQIAKSLLIQQNIQ